MAPPMIRKTGDHPREPEKSGTPVDGRPTAGSMSARGVDLEANRILAAMSPEEKKRLLPALVPVRLPIKVVLFEPGQAVEAVHFPLDGVVSLVTPLDDGAIVEVATVGNEGIVGVPLVAGGSLAVRAISQVAGRALRMSGPAFLAEVERGGMLGILVRRYTQALFGQISQAAACNRLHTNEERLSRWLLMSHDRVGLDQFAITHEFLGQMLGSRRATVTLSAGILQAAELIRYQRGHVTILDRPGLEDVACECYRVIKAELDQVVDRSTSA
jgi:CRP-like cAMP-binding protein